MNRKKFSDFVRYDNTLPLLLIVVFVGASSSFALTDPGVQNALLKPVSTVVSVDNTYIAAVDLSDYSPKVTISNVLEDVDSYTVTYNFETIELADAVWKPTIISRSLKVDKSVLGKYKDLGIFVTEELKQVIEQEKARLLATQEIEKKNISQKTIATEYTGLIGKLLDDETEVLPGYIPVVTEQPVDTITLVSQPKVPEITPTAANTQTETPTETATVTETTETIDENVNVQIVGASPEQITVGTPYVDKGVFVNNATLESIAMKLNGSEVPSIAIDTSVAGSFTVSYTVTTNKGVFSLERVVEIVEPAPVVDTPVETPVVETPVETSPVIETPIETPSEAPASGETVPNPAQ
jgi:hypothetical protein